MGIQKRRGEGASSGAGSEGSRDSSRPDRAETEEERGSGPEYGRSSRRGRFSLGGAVGLGSALGSVLGPRGAQPAHAGRAAVGHALHPVAAHFH